MPHAFQSATSLASHRTTCAVYAPPVPRCGELEQIQFLPGHVTVQTTERYLGCQQKLRDAAHDHIGLEPEEAGQG